MNGDSSEAPDPKRTRTADPVSSGDGDGSTPVSEQTPPSPTAPGEPSSNGNTASPAGASHSLQENPNTCPDGSTSSHSDNSPGAAGDDASPAGGTDGASEPMEPDLAVTLTWMCPADGAEDTAADGPGNGGSEDGVATAGKKKKKKKKDRTRSGTEDGAANTSTADGASTPGKKKEKKDGARSGTEKGTANTNTGDGAADGGSADGTRSGGEDGTRNGGEDGTRNSREDGEDAGRPAFSTLDDTATGDETDMDDMDDASLSSSSMDTDADAPDLTAALEDAKKKVDDIMQKPKPKHTWSLVKELHKRQQGDRPSLLQQDKFRLRLCSSLHAVERLELMDKLCFHSGCVNCLNFSRTGDLLASGSDDLNVVVWDWQQHRKAFYYNSGHKSNIFETKFVPQRDDTHIVSTSRDGQVRLAEISPAGECRSVRRLAQHRGSGRKLALPAHSPDTVLSCGEDAVVFSIDLRERQPSRLMTCVDEGKEVSTQWIAAHPEDDNVFLLACEDRYVRVYDRRMIGGEERAFRRLCPHRLLDDAKGRYSVTCAVFNYNGSEIVASYNDEDIFLFDASHSDGADAVRQYSGHRNSATIKGVNFYGPTSEYIVSGSDCGNIFFWDKQTEAILQCMPGDEKGVVNCLEPHPYMPVLATSGLDDDVKLWIASRDQPADLSSLKQTVSRNMQERVEDMPSADALGGSLMWSLMRQVFSSWSRRHPDRGLHRVMTFDRSSDESGGEEEEEGEEDRPGDCRPT